MAIAKGTKVRQVVPVVEGTVVSYQADQETGGVLTLVEWQDEEGNTHSKYFKEGEIEPIPSEE